MTIQRKHHHFQCMFLTFVSKVKITSIAPSEGGGSKYPLGEAAMEEHQVYCQASREGNNDSLEFGRKTRCSIAEAAKFFREN